MIVLLWMTHCSMFKLLKFQREQEVYLLEGVTISIKHRIKINYCTHITRSDNNTEGSI